MAAHRLALVIVGIACVGASGVGSYLATRHNGGQAEVVAAVTPQPTPEPAAATPAKSSSTPTTVSPSTPAASVPRKNISPSKAAPQAVRPSPRTESRSAEATGIARIESTAGPQVADALPAVPPYVEPLPTSQTASPVGAAPASQEPASSDGQAGNVDDRPQAAESTLSRNQQELVVAADSVIGIQTDRLVTSERARLEDRVEARVVRDVRVGGTVAIPAGTRAIGTVVLVERGGKVRERARLGIRFDTLQLRDGTRIAIDTEPIYRFGDSPSNGSNARIGGGAVAGAILGAIIGGGKGAAIGAATGAGAGTAAVIAGDRSPATIQPGTELTARIVAPIAVTVDRE